MKKYFAYAALPFVTFSSAMAADMAPIEEKMWELWSTELWEGSVEFGGEIKNGNTKRSALNAAININRKTDMWKTAATLSAKTVRESGVRTEEEYRGRLEAEHKIDERTFAFGDVEYVNDPFSSLEYRVTETVGVGYNAIKEEDMQLDLKLSVGGRHAQPVGTNVDQTNEFIVKPALRFNWNVNEFVTFSQDLGATIGSENTITESTTALKSKLANDWYFKAKLDVEHVSDVPVGRKKTDTATTLNLVYEF